MKQRIESASWRTRQKISQEELKKEKRLRKNEEGLRELQNNIICNNIHIIGILEGEEEQGIESLFEKVTMENFPNLMGEKVTPIQESQRVPSKRNPKRPTARHIIIKRTKQQCLLSPPLLFNTVLEVHDRDNRQVKINDSQRLNCLCRRHHLLYRKP